MTALLLAVSLAGGSFAVSVALLAAADAFLRRLRSRAPPRMSPADAPTGFSFPEDKPTSMEAPR